MRFICAYCPEVFPNFKELVQHYKDKHEERLRRFLIRNTELKQSSLLYAANLDECLRFLGWQIDDCKVEEFKNVSTHNPMAIQ